MKKLILISILLVSLSFLSFAQEYFSAQENKSFQSVGVPSSRIYKTRISLNNYRGQLKGVLFEIKDSSVLISNSLVKADYSSGNFKVTYIHFSDIDHLSIRKKNRVLNSTLLGSVAGFTTAYIAANSVTKNKDESAFFMFIYGVPSVALGACFGALIGSFRINFPVKGSFEYFKRNETRMEKYSYFRENSDGLNTFEKQYDHKWFLGLIMGPSFPSGDFADKPDGNSNESAAKTGGSGSFVLGYNFKENFGISVNYSNNTYNIEGSTTDKYWSLTSILAGPMFSNHLNNSLFLDLKPMIGYAFASQYSNNINEKSGNGPAIYPGASLRYNFSRRWCMLMETGLLLSNPEYPDGRKTTNAFNFGLGIAYRFR
jgi:hypothetical protein